MCLWKWGQYPVRRSPRHRHPHFPFLPPLYPHPPTRTITPPGYCLIDCCFVKSMVMGDDDGLVTLWVIPAWGGHIGGGRDEGSFCQHWERVNIEESWVSSLDRGKKISMSWKALLTENCFNTKQEIEVVSCGRNWNISIISIVFFPSQSKNCNIFPTNTCFIFSSTLNQVIFCLFVCHGGILKLCWQFDVPLQLLFSYFRWKGLYWIGPGGGMAFECFLQICFKKINFNYSHVHPFINWNRALISRISWVWIGNQEVAWLYDACITSHIPHPNALHL